MSSQPLPSQQEAQAQELVARLRPQLEQDLLALARLLVSKEDRDRFGDTELAARDLVHRLGAKAVTTHLAGKKRGTKVRASSVPTASSAPSFTATGTKAP